MNTWIQIEYDKRPKIIIAYRKDTLITYKYFSLYVDGTLLDGLEDYIYSNIVSIQSVNDNSFQLRQAITGVSDIYYTLIY